MNLQPNQPAAAYFTGQALKDLYFFSGIKIQEKENNEYASVAVGSKKIVKKR